MFFSAMLFVRSLLTVDDSAGDRLFKWLFFVVMLGLVFIMVYCSQFYENCSRCDKECGAYYKRHLQAYFAGIIVPSLFLMVMVALAIRGGVCPICE